MHRTPSDLQLVQARGGKVLHRTVFAALNLVPGQFGRYRVDRCGPEASLISERIGSGLLPLCIMAPGLLAFPYCANLGEYSNSDLSPLHLETQDGYPVKRQGAIMKFLTGNPLVELGVSRRSGSSFWIAGYPEWLSGTGQIPSVAGTAFGLTSRRCSGVWYNDMVPVQLAAPLVTKTYIGNKSAALTSFGATARRSYSRISGILEQLEAYASLEQTAGARERLWARALRAGYDNTEGTAGRASPDVLAEIGLRPEIWNDETDPGGRGEPSGPVGRIRRARDEAGDDDEVECDHCRRGCDTCLADNGTCSECGRGLT